MLKRLFLAAATLLAGVVANDDFSSLNLHGKGLLTIDNINITRVGGTQPFSLSSWFQIHIDNPESAPDQMQTLVALRGVEGSEKEMWRFGINTVKILNKTHTSLRLELNLPLTFTSISSPTYIVPLDTPVHVLMTWNGTLALYVNNIVSTYTTTWIQHNLTSTTMYIGATGYDPKANSGLGIPILPFVGTIQSLAYHHIALSSEDVTLIYNNGPFFNQTSDLPTSIYPTITYIFTPTYTSLNYTTGVYTFTPITFNTSSIAPNAISSGCNELKNSRLEYGRVGALYFRCPDEPQVTRPPTTPVPTTAAPTTQAPTTQAPTTQTPTTSTPTTTSAPTTIVTPTSSTGTTSTPTTTTSPSTTTTPPSTTTTPTSPSSTSSASSTGVSISSSIPSSTTSITSIDSFSSNNINGTDETGSKSSTGSHSSTGSGSSVFHSSTGMELSSTGTTTSTPTTSSPTTPDVIDDTPSSTGDAIFSSSSTGLNNTIAMSSASMTTSHGMITMGVMMVLAMFL